MLEGFLLLLMREFIVSVLVKTLESFPDQLFFGPANFRWPIRKRKPHRINYFVVLYEDMQVYNLHARFIYIAALGVSFKYHRFFFVGYKMVLNSTALMFSHDEQGFLFFA